MLTRNELPGLKKHTLSSPLSKQKSDDSIERGLAAPSRDELLASIQRLTHQNDMLSAENERLRLSEAKAHHRRLELADLYERAPVGYFTIDEFGFILDVNQTGAEMLGVEKEILLKLPLEAFVTKKDASIFFDHRHRLIQDGGRSACEVMITPRNKRSFPVRIESLVLGGDSWINRHLRLTICDISERKHMEHVLRRQEKMAALGQLTGGIAHDFNNILSTILATTDVLQARYGADPYLEKRLERIQAQSERAATLVGQLLAFGRQRPMQLAYTDMVTFLSETKPLIQRTLGEHINVTLSLEDESHLPVEIDQSQLQQVVLNLAINAGHAMPVGGTLEMRLKQRWLNEAVNLLGGGIPAGTWLVLEVTDSGHGIAPSDLARVIEPFFTTKPQGKGSGLGLSQVFGVMQQHRGGIDIESQLNMGTTVSLYLPTAPLRPAEFGNQSVTNKILRGGGETVLIIEDEPTVLEATTDMLMAAGYSVHSYLDSRLAVDDLRAQKLSPDLILSDVIMPHLSGPLLLAELRYICPTIPLVLMSGYIPESMSNLPKDSLVKAVLQKPFSTTEITLTISSVLKRESRLM